MSSDAYGAGCDRPWCIGHDDDGDHIPRRGHPTLHRCDQRVHDGTLLCPSYLNHDGEGGTYCPHADEHCAT